MSALPPSESSGSHGPGGAGDADGRAEAVFFLNGPPSVAADRLSGAILRARPGLLYVYVSD